jgi:hypothetical protein
MRQITPFLARFWKVNAAWLVPLLLTGAAAVLAWPHLSSPGLYYDEAVFAGQARDLLTGETFGSHMPGSVAVAVAGRPWPLFVQGYIGGLKSLLLAPFLALAGCTTEAVRGATLLWALAGLWLSLLLARRLLGGAAAAIAGLLLAFDPSFLLLAVHDWGLGALSLVLRVGGLLVLVSAVRRDDPRRWFAAALLFGLSFFHKMDSIVPLAAMGAAAVWSHGGIVGRIVRTRLGSLAFAGAGLLLGAGPILCNLPAMGRSAVPNSSVLSEWPEKLRILWSLLDGSYFLRLMEVGGRFDRVFAADTPVVSGLLVWLVCAALAWLALFSLAAPSDDNRSLARWLVAALALSWVGLLFLPGACRGHHWQQVYPLPHFAVALAWTRAWETAPARRFVRCALVLLLVAVLAADVRIMSATRALVQRTGGRGWWSDTISAFCREYETRRDLTIVSMDWGFHEQLLFLTRGPKLEEPIWRRDMTGPWRFDIPASPSTIYLVHPPEYGLMPSNRAFWNLVQGYGDGAAEQRVYRDREGRPAFVAVRWLRAPGGPQPP